jgi:hypothetical protein
MGTILKAEKFCVEFLKNEDFNKSVRSFEKDKFYGLKYISGEAKKLKDSLSYPFNPIYDGCTSFDDICKVVEDNCNGRLSGDSIVAIAAKIAYAKDINPDDSCWDCRIEKNDSLKGIGFCQNDVDKVISAYPEKALSKSDWKLLFLTRSKQIRKVYKKAEKMNN